MQRRAFGFLAVLLVLQTACPAAVLAQAVSTSTTTSTTTHLNLDLSSTQHTTTAPSAIGTHTVNILVGGASQAVNASSMLTAAERVAVYQVISTGQQSIALGALGNAIGGNLSIGTWLSQHISNLVIPQGVTALQNFGNASTLNLTGNLTNAGNFYAVSTNSTVHTATITAANIFNQTSGLISSVLPASGIGGISGALNSLNLQFNVVNNLVNSGSILSSGSLGITAGGTITNALPAGVTGVSPIMQAMGNLNLYSGAGTIVNNGWITSTMGNLNIASQIQQNLALQNLGGTLSALNGSINVRDATYGGLADTNLSGGDFLSKELNIYSGTGTIYANIGKVTGVINAQGGAAHITADTPTLTLGNMCMTGDPTYVNTAGNIEIDGTESENANLAIIAAGNIDIGANGGAGYDTKILDVGEFGSAQPIRRPGYGLESQMD